MLVIMESSASSKCPGRTNHGRGQGCNLTQLGNDGFSPGSFGPHDNEWMSQHLPLLIMLSGPPGNETSPPTPNPKPMKGAVFLALIIPHSALWKRDYWLAKKSEITLPLLLQARAERYLEGLLGSCFST